MDSPVDTNFQGQSGGRPGEQLLNAAARGVDLSSGGQIPTVRQSKVRNGKRVTAAGSGATTVGEKATPVAIPAAIPVAILVPGSVQRPPGKGEPLPTHEDAAGDVRVFVGDCREVLPRLTAVASCKVDLIFADPPFNMNRGYDSWDDNLPVNEYLRFTYSWLDLCIAGLRGGGSLWVNIPDDWAAEVVLFLKKRGLTMRNWCIWHYRFGQNTTERFINSKVHVLYFVKPGGIATWNGKEVLELSDRATTYFDPRTLSKKDGMPPGMRVPLDVWYGQYFGRVQGNSKERRNYHDNQLPEAYLNRVIRCASNPGDTVLDPFLGSGTTGVMAHSLKRKFIGVEFSPLNAANAFARMQAGPVRSYDEPTGSAIFRPRSANAKAKAAVLDKVKGIGAKTEQTAESSPAKIRQAGRSRAAT